MLYITFVPLHYISHYSIYASLAERVYSSERFLICSLSIHCCPPYHICTYLTCLIYLPPLSHHHTQDGVDGWVPHLVCAVDVFSGFAWTCSYPHGCCHPFRLPRQHTRCHTAHCAHDARTPFTVLLRCTYSAAPAGATWPTCSFCGGDPGLDVIQMVQLTRSWLHWVP